MKKMTKKELLEQTWKRTKWGFIGIACMTPFAIGYETEVIFSALSFLVICYLVVMVPFLIYVLYFHKE